jgi:phosphoribosylformylglycinamidine (FGAM) synthase-like enzyme
MGDACRVLDTPVTGGNVSFYNEDPERAVFPTPTIGMVGLISDIEHITTQWFKQNGDVIFLLGNNSNEIGASEYLHALHGMTKGAVPALDLEFEKKLQEGLLAAITRGWIRSAHDCAEGGLSITLAECCITDREQQIGSTVTLGDKLRSDALLFGESQSRVVISCAAANANAVAEFFANLELSCAKIGTVGGDCLKINDLIDLPLAQMDASFFEAMPTFMEKVG